jgi:hypothetical protein
LPFVIAMKGVIKINRFLERQYTALTLFVIEENKMEGKKEESRGLKAVNVEVIE